MRCFDNTNITLLKGFATLQPFCKDFLNITPLKPVLEHYNVPTEELEAEVMTFKNIVKVNPFEKIVVVLLICWKYSALSRISFQPLLGVLSLLSHLGHHNCHCRAKLFHIKENTQLSFLNKFSRETSLIIHRA